MPIGARIGSRVGSRFGSRVGSSPGSSWSVDAAGNIAFPATLAEWNTFISAKGLAISAPSSLYNAQESSGDLADAIGTVTLTHGSTPSYLQPISGLTRKGAKLADGTGQQFTAAAGVGPNPATTSQFWLGYFALPATPASTRAFWGINTNNVSTLSCRALHLITTGKLRIQCAAVNTDSVNAYSSGNHMISLKYDRAHSAAVLYTELEKLVGTYNSGVIDQIKGFGSSATDAATMAYAARWDGAAAETMTDANVKALYEAMLNSTMAWS